MALFLHGRRTRAQSEVVGVALLVGVFALLALLVGTVIIGNISDQASDEPLAEINASATAEDLTLTHGGGDSFEETAISVILRQNGDEARYGLESFTENRGSDTARFSAGERWIRNHTLETGLTRVLVVHRPSNAVVHDERIAVPPKPNTPPEAQFDYTPADPDPTENITVDATTSSDPGGNITSYSWDFSDGTTASGPITNHSYSEEGKYTVSLTVTDDRGAATTVSEQVTVDSTPPSITNATLRNGDDDGNVTSGDSVTISANVSDNLAGVDTVTADASSLDAGTVTLTDDNGNGTYTATTTVGPSPTEGEQSVTITAVDGAGNAETATTNTVEVNALPKASFSYTAVQSLNGEKITFDASNSTDPDGTITNYEWDFDDGNTTTTTEPVINHTYDSGDTYHVTLTVSDDDSATNTTAETIPVTVVTVVTAINAGGNDYTASDGTEYVADTSYTGGLTYATEDPIADTSDDLLYQSERYGDFSYEIPIENGEYRVTLQFAEIYWGGNGNGGGDGSHVFDTSIEGQQVLSSFDIHQQVGHDRAFDVRNVTTVTDGALTIRFSTIQDNAKVSAIVVENATGPNQPPTANFTPSDTAVGVGETVQFNDTSTDFDGVVQSWQWDFDDGTTSTERNPTHSYSQPGNYTVSLTVTDDDGATDAATTTITVENTPPTVELYYQSGTPAPGESITFQNRSFDPDGNLDTVEWTFGDGATASGDTVTHSYPTAGTHTVTLTVTDTAGASDTEAVTLSALSPVLINEYDESSGGGPTTLLASDFESGNIAPTSWTVDGGDGGVDASTANSGAYSAYHGADTGTLVSSSLDASDATTVDLSYWVRRGDDSFSEDPDGSEDLLVQYNTPSGNWETVETYLGGGTPGEIYSRTIELPQSAIHSDLQIRFYQTDGSGSGFDYWHVDDVVVTTTRDNLEFVTTQYGVDLSAYEYTVTKANGGSTSGRLGAGRTLGEGSLPVNLTTLGGNTDWNVQLATAATGESIDCVAGGTTYQGNCDASLSRQGNERIYYRSGDTDTDTATGWDRTTTDSIGQPNPGQTGSFRPEHIVVTNTSFESGTIPAGWTTNGTTGVATVTAGLGTNASYTGETASDITTATSNSSGVDTVVLSYWVRRGADSFSEDPDAGEDLEVQYRAADGTWQTLRSYAGEGRPGQIYVETTTLPADAVHEDFALRFQQLSASGSGFDYWHVDDVRIETND